MPLAKNDVSDGVALTTAEKSIKVHDECDPAFCNGREEHTELIFKMDNNILIIVSTRSCKTEISAFCCIQFLIVDNYLKNPNQPNQPSNKNPQQTRN